MSLITRCPACVTFFKVVPDQLRISDGWVRCGQCDEVFDASLHLVPAVPEVAQPATDQALPPDAADTPEDDLPLEFSLLPESSVAEVEAWVEPSAPMPLSEVPLPDEALSALPVDELVQPAEPQPTPTLDPDEATLESDAELAPVSFLRDQAIGSSRPKPWHRALLWGLGVVLLLGLSGQILHHERDRIAAAQPGLKSGLQTFCDLLNCTLAPLHRIDAIVIDSASFTKVRGDFYRLNFILKNTAALELALPAIELTLTDSSDQPVVRRVFLPAELGAETAALAAGAEWIAAQTVALKLAASHDRVAGYRVLAFYP